jgi:hypothetical protein
VSRPIVFEMDAELDGPPEVVWRLITDWERQGDWMREASNFVVTSPHREGDGVTAEATIRVAGIATRDRIRVDAWEPNRALGIEHLGWVSGRGDILLTDLGGGRTRFEWREQLVPPWGILGAIGMRALRPLLSRVFRRDIGLLADLVRRAAPGGYPGDH